MMVTQQGVDGWLFDLPHLENIVSDESKTMSDCRDFSKEDWIRLLNTRSNILGSQGIDYVHLAVPDKLDIIDTFANLPGINQENNPITQLSGNVQLETHSFIDVIPYYTKQLKHYPIFWKTNRFWTPWACYMAYQILCSRLHIKTKPDLLSYPTQEIDVSEWCLAGGQFLEGKAHQELITQYHFNRLSKRVYANPVVRHRENYYSDHVAQRLFDLSNNYLNPDVQAIVGTLLSADGAHVIYENPASHVEQKKIVIFGDNNSGHTASLLTGMLAETIREIHFVDSYNIDFEYVRQVRPDCVITQNSQSAMFDVPTDNQQMATRSILALDRLIEAHEKYESLEKNDGNFYFKGVGVTQSTLLQPESYDLNPPSVIQEGYEPAFQDKSMRTKPVTLFGLDQARLYLKGDCGQLLSGNGYEVFSYGSKGFDSNSLKGQDFQQLPGNSFLLAASSGTHCYYHWMLDILPKLGLLERSGTSLSSIDHFIIPKLSANFQKETLSILGIEKDRIVETQQQQFLRCENLKHIDLPNGINLKMNRFVPLWLKHQFLTTTAKSKGLKLYISRPGDTRRSISNEEELVPIIKRAGFTITAMEGLSVLEQAALLSQAEVVMSPHGGALSNIVFCRPGTVVIELFSRHVFPYYYGLAELCGHRYYALLQAPEEDMPRLISYRIAQAYANTHSQWESQLQSYSVQPELLEQLLNEVCRSSTCQAVAA